MNKIKFRCFGKVTFTNKCKIDKPLEALYEEKETLSNDDGNEDKITLFENKIGGLLIQKQRIEYEKKLSNLETLKTTKGRSAAVFNLKAKILGKKKVRQEATEIEDPATDSVVFEAEQI